MCFYCDQAGQKKSECSRLMSGSVRAPTPATLRIINSCEGRAEAPVVRSGGL